MTDGAERVSTEQARSEPWVLDVLVPHYQDIDALRSSLASVAAQTWTGTLRVVIVDDGSDAATFEQVRELAAAQPFAVTVGRLHRNMGRPVVRNALLDEVDAPFMAWLDAGEIWYPDKLQHQFARIEQLEAAGVDVDRVWVTCHYDWFQDGHARRVEQRLSADPIADLLIGDTLRAYLWTLLGRTSAFRAAGRFDEALPRLQDLDYFVRFLTAGGALTLPCTDEPLCRYDKSDSGRSHADVASCAAHIRKKHAPLYEGHGRRFVARAEWKYAKLSTRYALNNDAYGSAAKYLTTAVVSNPLYALNRLGRSVVRR